MNVFDPAKRPAWISVGSDLASWRSTQLIRLDARFLSCGAANDAETEMQRR